MMHSWKRKRSYVSIFQNSIFRRVKTRLIFNKRIRHKYTIVWILLWCSPLTMYAQRLTQEQAISYANKLYEKEILSKLGKEALTT